MKVIIADTSCLIIYHKIDQFEILRETFSDLMVTKEVAEEFGELPDWVAIKEVEDKGQYLKLAEDLGKGEASSKLTTGTDAALQYVPYLRQTRSFDQTNIHQARVRHCI